MNAYYIYRTNHVKGRMALDRVKGATPAEAVAEFERKNAEAKGTEHYLNPNGGFVAEQKARTVAWWLY